MEEKRRAFCFLSLFSNCSSRNYFSISQKPPPPCLSSSTRKPTSCPHQPFFPGVRRCTNLFSCNLSAGDFCCGRGACFRGKETAGHRRSFPPGVNSPNQPPKKHSLAIRAVVSLRLGDVPLGKLKKGLHSQQMAPFKASLLSPSLSSR